MPYLEELDAIFQGATVISTVALVFVAYLQIGSLKKQARTDFANKLSEQYREIMKDIPIEIWFGDGLDVIEDDARRSRCRDAIYRYIELSQEQAFLYQTKKIAEEVWEEWRSGIKSNFRLKVVADTWQEVKAKRPDEFAELRNLVG